MSVNTSFSLPWILGTPGSTTTGRGATSSNSASGSNNTGLPDSVTLNSNTPAFTGFTDYTQLGNSGLWQFDLAGLLNFGSSGVPSAARSAAQQKADDAALQQALGFIDAGQSDKARSILNGLLVDNKTNAAAVDALGQADLTDGKYAEAERWFLRAHALNPAVGYDSDAETARVLRGDDASVLTTARQWVSTPLKRDSGTRLLTVLTQRSSNNAAAHLLLGDTLLDAGDGNNGLLQYSVAISYADPKLLGDIQQRLTTMVDHAPKSAFVRQLLGRTYLRQERYDDAIKTLTEAKNLAKDPAGYGHDLATAYIGLGRAQLASGDLPSALRQFAQAQELDPTASQTKQALNEGLVAQAEQHARQHDYKAAAADYTKLAISLGTKGNDTLRQRAAQGAYSVGRTLMNKRIAAGGDIKEELSAFQAAYDLDNSNQTFKHQLATTRAALGDQLAADGKYKDAANSYREAWKLAKTNLTYRDKAISAFVTYGDDRAFNLNYTTAIDAYRAAYEMNTLNGTNKQKLATAYNTRGVDYMDRELWAKAARDFKEALSLYPDNATYQHNYLLVSPWDPAH